MDQKILKQLEFPKLIKQIVDHAETTRGKEAAAKLMPSADFEEVIRWQNETDEAVQVLRTQGHMPLGGIHDLRGSTKRAKIGGMLSATELLEISDTLRGSKRVKNFVQDIDEVDTPILVELVEQIEPLSNLEKEIHMCIDQDGKVIDSASQGLRRIRSQIRSLESSIRDRLEGYTRTSSSKLSDAIVTIRNERYVLPVKSEHRGSFGGIVHDSSSSGQTLFIEPQAVVELNNKLQASKVEEQQEIERILTRLTELVQQEAELLEHNGDILQKIDFLFAKGKYGQQLRAAKPEMNHDGYIKMIQARHPLIPESEVVSNDIEIGKDYRAILITGPNTGGKTVTLKLVGLCTLMAQSGLQVPALDGCQLAVFDHVFADIGDEQSIEQNLSTFSSHMTNIASIIERFNSNSLVLFDELGAGTDPQEGAGLAMSILDYVVNRNARVIATTHYPELKAYGYNREQVINASVEFDVETLQPTYRLLIGVPGRSNAFEISGRIGLKSEIIDQAKTMIHEDSRSVENMIASLETSRKQAEKDFEEAEEILQESEGIREELKREYDRYLAKKEDYQEAAKKKAQKIVDQAEQEAETILQELRQMKSSAEIKEHQLIDARKKISDQKEALQDTNQKQQIETTNQPDEFEPGDEVHVASFNQKGQIVSQLNDNEYEVQLGIMKMKVPKKQLQLIKRKEKEKKTTPMATVRGRQSHVKTELDLRGERYEDALHRLEKYLDNALLAGYHQVSIIHGKGTGALMKGVHAFARKHRSINSYHLGHPNEGGSGVTILSLK